MNTTNQQKFPNAIHLKGISKCIILLFSLCLFTNTVQAQIYESCTHRDYYKYNDATEELEYLNGYDENSMFKINAKLTMFEHTTPGMSSSYYVSESDYDEDEKTLTLDVVSAVGNNYRCIFDMDENKIKFLFKRDGVVQLLIFTVKKFWTEE